VTDEHQCFHIVYPLIAILVLSVPASLIQSDRAYGQTALTQTVEITPGSSIKLDDAYSPNPVRLQVGGTVRWVNYDSVPHTTTSGTAAIGPDGEFGGSIDLPKILAPSDEQSHTFMDEDEYPYYCILHPSMTGTVIVGNFPPQEEEQEDEPPSALATDQGPQDTIEPSEPTLPSRAGWTTYVEQFHGIELSHPEEWREWDKSITDGNFTLITRFDRGFPNTEPFLNIAFHDLSKQGNLTLEEFTGQQIEQIEIPLTVGERTLYESVIVKSEEVIFGNRSGYSVVWEEHDVDEALLTDESDRKMSVWTLLGHKAWEVTYVAPDTQSYEENLPVIQQMIDSFTLLPRVNFTANDSEYKDGESEFSIHFPRNWTYDDAGSTIFLHPPEAIASNTIVSITHDQLPIAVDIETFATATLNSLTERRDVEISAQGFTSLAGYPAWYLIYENRMSGLTTLQLGALKDASSYIITFAAIPDRFNVELPTVRGIIDSFEFYTTEEEADETLDLLGRFDEEVRGSRDSPDSDDTEEEESEEVLEEVCDSSYPDVCIPTPPPDLDCGDVNEEGFVVRKPDPHRFDGDNDGLGCE
jgi:plastocyanin